MTTQVLIRILQYLGGLKDDIFGFFLDNIFYVNKECSVSNGLHILPQMDYNILMQGCLPPPNVIEPNSVRFSWNAVNITDYEPYILYLVINII